MDLLRRLGSFALVGFSVLCMVAWAANYNPAAFGVAELYIPFTARALPPNGFMGPLIFAFGSFLVAYLVYPPRRDDD
ncbi:MAG: hypothetical protein H6732_06155 [Alphaproteobacteria bacterium]|nr:hypothetical protein [Alphaproteobacteria bacterium]